MANILDELVARYRELGIDNQIDYEKLIRFKKAKIKMHVQPFKYPLEETPVEITNQYVTNEAEEMDLDNTKEAPMTIALKGNTSQDGTPTPEAPVEVSVVSGDNSIVVSNGDNTQSASYPISLGDKELCKIGTYQDKIDKSTGRNLCGYDNTLPYTSGGVTLTREENSYYKTSGTSSVWFNKNVYTIPAGTLNGTYTIKKIQYSGTNEASIRIVDRTVSPVVIYAETNSSQTFTISNNNNLSVEVVISLNHSSNDTFNILLQEASETNLEYEPYGTNWYLKKEIQKTTVTNDNKTMFTNWTEAYNTKLVSVPKTTLGWKSSWDNEVILVNSYKVASTVADFKSGYVTGGITQGSFHFFNDDFTDLTTAQDALVGTIIYCALATPTYETITDTTLLSQLEALKNASSYDTKTHITQNSNDKPFILNATALQKGEAIVNNEGNIYSKPTLDIEGSGTVGIYLDGNQMFTIDLSNSNECVIDTTKLEAYNPTTSELMNRQVTGDYSNFKLNAGDNQVEATGDITKVTISNYTRWL